MRREGYSSLIFVNSNGLSMWPFLKPGDKLMIKKFPLENMKIGDIILYREDARMVCHRLVKKIKNEEGCVFFTRGDSSFDLSGPIIEEDIIGKVTGLIRNNCRIIDLTGVRNSIFNKCIVRSAPFVTLWVKAAKYFCLSQNKEGI